MSAKTELNINGDQVDRLVPKLDKTRRILLWGEMGAGKSTLAVSLLKSLHVSGIDCQIVELDPGTPPFGVPGTVCRGRWRKEEGKIVWSDVQALCSLNGGRFRLPLITLAKNIVKIIDRETTQGKVLIDPPGVVRGVGGAELLTALVETLGIDLIIVLCREGKVSHLFQELEYLEAAKLYIGASPRARRPGRLERGKARTRLWNRFLTNAVEEKIKLERLHVLGTPPPPEAMHGWTGRQAALLDTKGGTVRVGEVIELKNGVLTLRMVPGSNNKPVALLIRDAGRDATGRFATITPFGRPSSSQREPQEMTPPVYTPQAGFLPVSSRMGPAWATLVGGVFGDPLLHVRLRDLKKSFLFDLGDPARLAAKVAHQVEGVFLSHAHLDHIGGFIWFLRSRIRPYDPCKIFGPLGTINHIASFLNGINWDRIGDKGPVFEVTDIEEDKLRRVRLQPGRPSVELSQQTIKEGVILSDEKFTIRAVVCDHKTPSVAYSLIFSLDVKIRKDQLEASGLSPGPWLGQLKHCLGVGTPQEEIELPNGTSRKAEELARELVYVRPGKKLVYAADMADTPENRRKLIRFARSAHTLFCETAFSIADRDRAVANQHLTTLAAIEIARQAGAQRLVPFHFSKRYQHTFPMIYKEILAAAGPVKILGHYS